MHKRRHALLSIIKLLIRHLIKTLFPSAEFTRYQLFPKGLLIVHLANTKADTKSFTETCYCVIPANRQRMQKSSNPDEKATIMINASF
jgi:hypothetical protein